MRTTQEIRQAWGPACTARGVSLISAYKALNAVFRRWNYRPRAGQTWGYNCRRITGGTGYSLHAYDPGERFVFWSGVAITTAIACDINSLANPYGPRLITDMPRGMIDDVLAIRTVDGVQVFKWGGYYTKNKDAMHFEIQASPAELVRGIMGIEEGPELDKEERTKLDEIHESVRVKVKNKPETGLDRYFKDRLDTTDNVLKQIAEHLGVPVPEGFGE